jgi:hypothetical protein
MESVGKTLALVGLFLVLLGGALIGLERLGIPLGRLPGDIHMERGRSSFHFPIVTSLVLSVVATLVFNLFRR